MSLLSYKHLVSIIEPQIPNFVKLLMFLTFEMASVFDKLDWFFFFAYVMNYWIYAMTLPFSNIFIPHRSNVAAFLWWLQYMKFFSVSEISACVSAELTSLAFNTFFPL